MLTRIQFRQRQDAGQEDLGKEELQEHGLSAEREY